jgi:hypothetical protein
MKAATMDRKQLKAFHADVDLMKADVLAALAPHASKPLVNLVTALIELAGDGCEKLVAQDRFYAIEMARNLVKYLETQGARRVQ